MDDERRFWTCWECGAYPVHIYVDAFTTRARCNECGAVRVVTESQYAPKEPAA